MTEEEFDQEDFAIEVDDALQHVTKRIYDFFHYAGDTYKIKSKSFEEEGLYVDVNYNEDISGEDLILTITFDTNQESGSENVLEYTVNGYDIGEVAQALDELYMDMLDNIYKDNNEMLKSLSKDDISALSNKRPDDNYLKSLVGGNTYKLFDAFVNDLDKIDDLEVGDESARVAEEIREYLDDEYFKGISDYGNYWFMVGNEVFEELIDDMCYVSLEYLDDNRVSVVLDSNNDGIKRIVKNDAKIIAEALNGMIKERLMMFYEEDKANVKFLPKGIIKLLSDKYPEDNHLKSLLGGNKYKLFDSFNPNEILPELPYIKKVIVENTIHEPIYNDLEIIGRYLVKHLEDILKDNGWVDVVNSKGGEIIITHRYRDYEDINTLEEYNKDLDIRKNVSDVVNTFIKDFDLEYTLSHSEDTSIHISYVDSLEKEKFGSFVKSLTGINKFKL